MHTTIKQGDTVKMRSERSKLQWANIQWVQDGITFYFYFKKTKTFQALTFVPLLNLSSKSHSKNDKTGKLLRPQTSPPSPATKLATSSCPTQSYLFLIFPLHQRISVSMHKNVNEDATLFPFIATLATSSFALICHKAHLSSLLHLRLRIHHRCIRIPFPLMW